ncbi:hypothetical protein ACFFHJ_10490 [Planotetraspora thailandica]|uniref:hypothetical protein n=1 Tax=Planotetraspora thailandica TaxID=487172 RepID=UPI0019515DC1|nr:hypothetical protein [Planotetraspora thailandica]
MRPILVIPVLLCGLALSAACSTSPKGPGIASANRGTASARPSASPTSDPAAFVRCMREHGQAMPDLGPNEPLRLIPPRGELERAWRTALQACQRFLPEGERLAGPPPEQLEQLRAFAVCMRAHDIEMTDPAAVDGNMVIKGRFANVTRAQLESDPVYKAAIAACKDKLPQEQERK